MGSADLNKTDKLIREIIGAYQATKGQDMSAPDHVKHLRYQVARLVRVCMELNRRVLQLESRGPRQEAHKESAIDAENDLNPETITAIGDII